ncbi:GILT-like protein 1 [Dendroctonus ponderosae]|uniref:Gamma-interferon-inducible lysosomal thiol reductase n=1 Tax=Dendroctonus ponderosae TaxID=77166 RepID=J3JTK7_DENPD|nr:GILT-like protein 1 [Dendroctonus ponderosae]AEE61528.1 unknown [Dendroctonus ponderosae]
MLVNRNMVRLLCLMICFAGAIESIHVAVYYEALCSDSVYFITRQLYPNYQLFKDHMTVEFIPYGKAIHTFDNTTGKYTFSCQHGKEECKGNKFQACGLAQIANEEERLDFVTCVMSASNPANIFYLENCAKKSTLDFSAMTKCAISSEGDKLLASYGDKTWNLEPNLSYVPTVVFNHSVEINFSDMNKSLVDFKSVMCSKIEQNHPDVCKSRSFMSRIKQFFSQQF